MIFGKKTILFFKNSFTRINHCKFIHLRSHLKPFLSYLPCIVHRKYFSIIFHVKSALYSIKYCTKMLTWLQFQFRIRKNWWIEFLKFNCLVCSIIWFELIEKCCIGDDILTKSSNVKININNICNLISLSSERFN